MKAPHMLAALGAAMALDPGSGKMASHVRPRGRFFTAREWRRRKLRARMARESRRRNR